MVTALLSYLFRLSASCDDMFRSLVNFEPLFNQLQADATVATGDQHGTGKHLESTSKDRINSESVPTDQILF